jgi:hypothetical protein
MDAREKLIELDALASEAMTQSILRYGGRCRDCADMNPRGLCDNRWLPCDPTKKRAAVEFILSAQRYYLEHPEFLAEAPARAAMDEKQP